MLSGARFGLTTPFRASLIGFLLLLCVLVTVAAQCSLPLPSPSPTATETALTDEFVSSDGLLSIRLPAGWESEDYEALRYYDVEGVVVGFGPPDREFGAGLMIFNVTSENMAFADGYGTPAKVLDGVRNGDERMVGSLGTVLQQEDLRVGGHDCVKLVTESNTSKLLYFICALNDQWVVWLSLGSDDPAGPEQYERVGIDMLESLHFALGESVISSPILNAELPEQWVLSDTRQNETHATFVLHPRGGLGTESNVIWITAGNLAGDPLFEVLNEEGLDALLATFIANDGAVIQGGIERGTFAGYDVVIADATIQESPAPYHRYIAGSINESRLFLIVAGSDDPQRLADISADAETIFAGAEISWPLPAEDTPSDPGS